jgi:hypothetical protein
METKLISLLVTSLEEVVLEFRERSEREKAMEESYL